MIPAVSTGITIVWVSERNQTAPDERRRHADQQPGGEAEVAEPARGGEDPAQLARLDLDELIAAAGRLPGAPQLPS